jgi:Uma2 family endonuclease
MTQILGRNATQPVPQPLTVKQYELLGQAGLLPERTELLKGVIVLMPPMGDEHVDAIATMLTPLAVTFGTRARVTSQTPVRLEAAFGEPEPDFMLCKPESRGVANPEDVLLVIEISKSTYQTDRDDKLPMYAQHRIPEVWIHNLNNNTLEVYRNPHLVSSGWTYDASVVVQQGTEVAPLAFPNDALKWW